MGAIKSPVIKELVLCVETIAVIGLRVGQVGTCIGDDLTLDTEYITSS